KPPASGASGSCMISANDLVPAGASFHSSAGDGFCMPASQVNFEGMLLSLVNAGLVMVNAPAMMNPIIADSLCFSTWRRALALRFGDRRTKVLRHFLSRTLTQPAGHAPDRP